MHVSSRLKKFRIRNRIKLQEIAKESGLDEPTVSRIENGWKPVTAHVVVKLRNGYSRLRVFDDVFFDALEAQASKLLPTQEGAAQ